MKILKSFADWLLCFLTPFLWIIGIALGSVVAIFVFIIFAIYSLFLFFTGRNMLGDLPEDEKVKEFKLKRAQQRMEMNNPVVQPVVQQAPVAPTPAPVQSIPVVQPQVIQPTPVVQPVPQPLQQEVTPNDIAYAQPEKQDQEEEVEQYEIPF